MSTFQGKPESKSCVRCGCEIFRGPYTNDYAWRQRRFCSGCGGPNKRELSTGQKAAIMAAEPAFPIQVGKTHPKWLCLEPPVPGAKMATDDEFAKLMSQVRSGDQAAAWTLIEVYGSHVLKVIRRSLNNQLRSKFDSQDFVQTVWKSFFRDRDRLLAMQSPEQLVGYIQAIARNKVIDETRRRQTAKYNIAREEGFDDAIGNGPRPSEIAIVRETWDRLMAGKSDDHRRVVEMRFQGHTFAEIAKELSINERTARRVIASLLE
jgi:RNA polymerase sigma-70 factor (ECF subfamily)